MIFYNYYLKQGLWQVQWQGPKSGSLLRTCYQDDRLILVHFWLWVVLFGRICVLARCPNYNCILLIYVSPIFQFVQGLICNTAIISMFTWNLNHRHLLNAWYPSKDINKPFLIELSCFILTNILGLKSLELRFSRLLIATYLKFLLIFISKSMSCS